MKMESPNIPRSDWVAASGAEGPARGWAAYDVYTRMFWIFALSWKIFFQKIFEVVRFATSNHLEYIRGGSISKSNHLEYIRGGSKLQIEPPRIFFEKKFFKIMQKSKTFACKRRMQLSPERGLRRRSQRPNLSEVYWVIPFSYIR